jgi:5'-deoxynucleotidase YfbR-like HD superfamily hydrolase
MLSGRRLDLIDPSPLDIEISDIAHGLARVARWNGQTRGPEIFSVAQHSLLVEELFGLLAPESDNAARLAALLHDAAEYVIGDMISPFKAAIGGDYKRIEQRIQSATHLRFGLPAETARDLAARIKIADRTAAYFEAYKSGGFCCRGGGEILWSAKDCAAGCCTLSQGDAAGRGAGFVPSPLRPIVR